MIFVATGVSDSLLDEKTEGGRLRLAAGGAWIAKNAHALEAQIDHAAHGNDGVKNVDIDLSGIARLDTFGAWRHGTLQPLAR